MLRALSDEIAVPASEKLGQKAETNMEKTVMPLLLWWMRLHGAG